MGDEQKGMAFSRLSCYIGANLFQAMDIPATFAIFY
jgi:hypothetical protein